MWVILVVKAFPDGVVYSGASEIASMVDDEGLNAADHYDAGQIQVGGVSFLWSLDTAQSDVEVSFFLNGEMS